jgi:hypothetical protein
MVPSVMQVLTLLLTFAGASASAGERRTAHFSALMNDYSPSGTSVKGSPWEMHGEWSMDIDPEWEVADFETDMTRRCPTASAACANPDTRSPAPELPLGRTRARTTAGRHPT